MALKKDLIKRINNLEPIVQVGKNGLNENLLKEIQKNLKAKKLIKIKFSKSFIEALDYDLNNKSKLEMIANDLSKEFHCEIIQVKGFTISLYNGTAS